MPARLVREHFGGDILRQMPKTNSTAAQLDKLNLVAAPSPQIRSIVPDGQTGDVLLEWDDNGGSFQLERGSIRP
jgi:hypothetical protein